MYQARSNLFCLPVGKLCSGGRSGSSGRRNRCNSRGAANGLDVDDLAVAGAVLAVQVGEVAALARVPGGHTTVVGEETTADGEAGGGEGVRLWWRVELELAVGGDVASAALRIGEDATGEAHCKLEAIGLTLFDGLANVLGCEIVNEDFIPWPCWAERPGS